MEHSHACTGINYHDYIQKNAANIAQTVQEYTEKAVITLIQNLIQKYNAEYLCLGGGLFLNCLLNQKITETCHLREVFIFPASGDDGQAIGNAFFAYKKHFPQMPNPHIKLPYLGFSACSDKEHCLNKILIAHIELAALLLNLIYHLVYCYHIHYLPSLSYKSIIVYQASFIISINSLTASSTGYEAL